MRCGVLEPLCDRLKHPALFKKHKVYDFERSSSGKARQPMACMRGYLSIEDVLVGTNALTHVFYVRETSVHAIEFPHQLAHVKKTRILEQFVFTR